MARRYVLPRKFKWRLSIILQRAQTPAQGQCLEISLTTNPKNTLNPKQENTAYMQYFLQSLILYATAQHTASVGNYIS